MAKRATITYYPTYIWTNMRTCTEICANKNESSAYEAACRVGCCKSIAMNWLCRSYASNLYRNKRSSDKLRPFLQTPTN